MLESRACEVLRRYAAFSQRPVSLPVPVERVVEDVAGLDILWDPIREPPGETILAGLNPQERLIVFNESRRPLFDDTKNLYRTVLGHEVGHWQLHVDHSTLDCPMLPGFERPLQFICRHGADSWEERQANWFSSYVLLPRDLLRSALAGREIRSLADMYPLRDECGVTISMMRIALEELGYGYIDDSGRLHPSKQESLGQRRLV